MASLAIRVRRAFEQGKDNLDWYSASQQGLEPLFNPWSTFAGCLAATSPKTRPTVNLQLAYRAWHAYKQGYNPQGFTLAHKYNLWRVFTGHSLRGPKVEPFWRALCGDPDAIVIDRWMARLHCNAVKKPCATCWIELPSAFKKLARQEGLEARQIQAACWAGIKRQTLGKVADVRNYWQIYQAHLRLEGF